MATEKRADAVLSQLEKKGWKRILDDESLDNIAKSGIRKNLGLAFVAAQYAYEQKPITLRGLLYRIVSGGWLPSTDKEYYNRVGRLLVSLRESGLVDFSWIVDNIRSSIKPSSWSGLEVFAEVVKRNYRKDYWSQLPNYVHIICEKDAIAGVIAPSTEYYDVTLSPIRGYVSLSFANEIARLWNRIEKPIYCYYLGDFDASGFDLERDVKAKLTRYCNRDFNWVRLGVNKEDFAAFDLISLKPKKGDSRYRKFVAEHGTQCAELDALPATEIRDRVEKAITRHFDEAEWKRLQLIEKLERETVGKLAFLEKQSG